MLKIPEIFHLEDRAGRRFILPVDPRGDVHLPRARAAELPAAAAGLVPLPDQGPRRAAAARRADPRARVHHEGLLLVRPRRGGPRAELPGARGRLPCDLRPRRARVLRGPGRVGDDGRQRVGRLPRPVGLGREHARDLCERRLSPPTSRSPARCRARRSSRRRSPAPRGGRDARSRRRSRPRRLPRHRRRRDHEGDAGDQGGRHGRPRARPRRRPPRAGES